jgi:hypothetical protein
MPGRSGDATRKTNINTMSKFKPYLVIAVVAVVTILVYRKAQESLSFLPRI